MSDIEVEGVYPIEDPGNLPIKTVDFGRARIFVRGNVMMEHIIGLADVTIDEDQPLVGVRFSVWEDSGFARSLDRQLFMATMGAVGTEPEGKLLYVFDPFEISLWKIDESILSRLVEANGHFWQVARFFGADRIGSKYLDGNEPNISRLQITCDGFQRFNEPRRLQFGLNKAADLYVGDIKFNVSYPNN